MIAIFTFCYIIFCGGKDMMKADDPKKKDFDPSALPYSTGSQEEALIGKTGKDGQQNDDSIEVSLREASNRKLNREIDMMNECHRNLTPQIKRHRSRFSTT